MNKTKSKLLVSNFPRTPDLVQSFELAFFLLLTKGLMGEVD